MQTSKYHGSQSISATGGRPVSPYFFNNRNEIHAISLQQANDSSSESMLLNGIGVNSRRFFHIDMVESDLTVASDFSVESMFYWGKSGVDELLYNNQNIGTEWWIILSYSSAEYPVADDGEERIPIEFVAEGSDAQALIEQIEGRNHDRMDTAKVSDFILYYNYSNGANLVLFPLHQIGKIAINELDIMMMLRVLLFLSNM
jgi:hypothetical protein